MKKHNILITGGHFTAALAVVESLHQKGYNNISWVGHTYTMIGDSNPSAEYQEITKLQIPFYSITAGKLYRYFSMKGLLSFLYIPIGFIQAFIILIKIHPSVIVSFGGYISLPVAWCGWILRIPVITHEQTVTVGRSNQLIALCAKKILLTWPSAAKYFPKTRVTLTGNPLRRELFIHDRPFYEFNSSLPTLLIMGGNQGSHTINEVIKESLPELTKHFTIIHQCGSNSIYMDYEHLAPLTKHYPGYKVYTGIWGDDFGRAINQSSYILSRSGANTVYEIAALGKPTVFIPLAYAVNNEQFQNAKILEVIGLASILEEKNLTPQTLLEALLNLTLIRNKPQPADFIRLDAADRIADIVIETLSGR